jgi:hypothetical protein
MKVICEYSGEDFEAKMKMSIDGKRVFSIYDMSECPEDANLMRDLNFVYEIPDLLKQAYEAGKKGEPFELIQD